MKKNTVFLMIFFALILSGCIQTSSRIIKTPYERSYDREIRRLQHYEWEKVIRRIAIHDAQNNECYLHSFAEVPLYWVSYYFDTCEREQKLIFQREIWADRWRKNLERWRGRRDAQQDFYNR